MEFAAVDGGFPLCPVTVVSTVAFYGRAGLVSGCNLVGFGNSADCVNGDDDNNGLWTSLVVAAEVFHYVATNDPAAADLAWHYYDGMRLLNRITGIRVGAVSGRGIPPARVCVHPVCGCVDERCGQHHRHRRTWT